MFVYSGIILLRLSGSLNLWPAFGGAFIRGRPYFVPWLAGAFSITMGNSSQQFGTWPVGNFSSFDLVGCGRENCVRLGALEPAN